MATSATADEAKLYYCFANALTFLIGDYIN